MKAICILLGSLFHLFFAIGQNTTGHLRGSTLNQWNQAISQIRILLIHHSTNEIFETQSNTAGIFHFLNLPPGGPYDIKAMVPNADTLSIQGIVIHLAETLELAPFIFIQKQPLPGVSVQAFTQNKQLVLAKGNHQRLDHAHINELPSDGSFLDYLRVSPKIFHVLANPGAISFGGQNNRFNAFYINGTEQQDQFGLSNTGTYGGQTGFSPIAMESIEEIQVNNSPFDPIYGNFTGGLIQAITKSGSNQTHLNLYWNFNASSFQQGFHLGAPLIKQKLFYFISWDKTDQSKPINTHFPYLGNTNSQAGLEGLSQFLQTQYHYHPGKFQVLSLPSEAKKWNLKMDWKLDQRHKFSFSFRSLNFSKQVNQTHRPEDLYFENNGYRQENRQFQTSIEIKSIINRFSTNRLQLSYHKIEDNKSILGYPFPSIRIQDGLGTIQMGSNSNASQNHLINNVFSVLNQFKFYKSSQVFQMGFELNFSQIQNRLIPQSLGDYHYASLANFVNNVQAPTKYRIQFSLNQPSYQNIQDAGIEMKIRKWAVFFSDEIRLKKSLRLLLGFRIDATHFLSPMETSTRLLNSSLTLFQQHYPAFNHLGGNRPRFPIGFSPRLSLVQYVDRLSTKFNLGLGIFQGQFPMVWLAGCYQLNGQKIGSYETNYQNSSFRFKWNGASLDANLWRPDTANLNAIRYPINLIVKQLVPPKIIKLSLESTTDIGELGTINTYVNIHKSLAEIRFTNLNLLPSQQFSQGDGARKVYSIQADGSAQTLPILSNGSNPFQQVILLSNQSKSLLGNGIEVGLHYFKKWRKGIDFNCSYQFGKSISAQDGMAFYNFSNWAYQAAVNGRNEMNKSHSHFSLGHRIVSSIIAHWNPPHFKQYFTLSILYHVQSGGRYSYIYSGKSPTQDNGIYGSSDLIYIPTEESLTHSRFLPLPIDSITYSPDFQKLAFNQLIQNDPYLKKHRGEFAERNGAQLPFSHRIDLKISCWIKKSPFPMLKGLQISCQVINLGQLIAKKGGVEYDIPFQQVPIIEFAGYENPNRLIPSYRFDPRNLQILALLKNNYQRMERGWSLQMGLKWNL